jgi:hypothetical protein
MHKKLLVFLAFLGSLTSTNAQFKKSDKMLGASVASLLYNSGNSTVSFTSFPGYKSKTTSWGVRVEPSMGWFLSDKTAVGVTVNIHPFGQKVSYQDNGTTFQEDKSSNFDLGLGVFARHYLGSGGDFLPFGQAGFNVGMSSSSTEGFRYYDSTPDYKISYEGDSDGGFFANASLQLGLTKMVSESTGLDLYLGYTYSYNKNTFKTETLTDIGIDGTIETRSENEPTTKFTNHGFIIGVGFQVFLRGKSGK